jgi:hypothetical protein
VKKLTIQDALESARTLSHNAEAPNLRNAGRSLCDAFKLILGDLGRTVYGSEFLSNLAIKIRFETLCQSVPELRDYRRLAHRLDTLRNKIEHNDSHCPGKREIEDLIKQVESFIKMMPSLTEKLRSQRTIEGVERRGKSLVLYHSFSSRLDLSVDFLERGGSSSGDVGGQLKALAESFRQCIDGSGPLSVEMATAELFKRLYRFSEQGELVELYSIFKELFDYAYAKGRQVFDSMIYAFELIMFESWIPRYDVERAGKAAKVLLRLGIEFLTKDLSVTRQCAIAIHNLASDMFEPEVLAKEIILAACAYERTESIPGIGGLIDELLESIGDNDQEAWSDGVNTYLSDSIKCAHTEREQYRVDMSRFEEELLNPVLQHNIDANIRGYVESLKDIEDEGRESLKLARAELVDLISDYGPIRPAVADDIRKRILEMKDQKVERAFGRIVSRSKTLRRTYQTQPTTRSGSL